MKLVLAVAVLLMTLSAVVTDSNEDGGKEPTMAQKFEKYQKEIQTFVDNLGEKTKAALLEFHNSEFSNKTRKWLSETFQKLKKKFEPMPAQDGSD
ncbi:apolipoprotein C-I [Ahaetulla prasina]|uniref:apolipoprotein C-I n=1 Tax=Ahaetulla prasina TaxID=499056 RepID=UPI002647B286|nr:apolipoprotein C-I [Ahaetulla prasina]XP_058051688.1 apolipoprotein C-I [Ahaetulla prasina]XP_058051689.1 apolipoprotein C-I [Ahaetulla prasina]XP_058051690.1 apolipoprotein C-I [Ahaetulla prasina]XP_058051691.1 apolipoprotein C-I [Ahaetulla prasina]